MTTAMTEDRLLLPKEAADFLQISTRHLGDLARAGTVPSVPLGKLRRYRAETLREFVAERERRG
jgi:excisionase family DNA binding protein